MNKSWYLLFLIFVFHSVLCVLHRNLLCICKHLSTSMRDKAHGTIRKQDRVLIFYCCMTNYSKFKSITQHTVINSQFSKLVRARLTELSSKVAKMAKGKHWSNRPICKLLRKSWFEDHRGYWKIYFFVLLRLRSHFLW